VSRALGDMEPNNAAPSADGLGRLLHVRQGLRDLADAGLVLPRRSLHLAHQPHLIARTGRG
jgi:hypothetical protein